MDPTSKGEGGEENWEVRGRMDDPSDFELATGLTGSRIC